MKIREMWKIATNSYLTIFNNFFQFLLLTIFIGGLSSFVMMPIVKTIFNFALSLVGLVGVNNTTIFQLVRNPFAVLLVIVAIAVIALFTILEISLLINFLRKKCMMKK